MHKNLFHTTAVRAAGLAATTALASALATALIIGWMRGLRNPDPLDLALSGTAATLCAYLTWWSATAVRPCWVLFSTRASRQPSTESPPSNDTKQGARHAAAADAHPRAVAFFIAFAALTTSTISMSSAHAQTGYTQVVTPDIDRLSMPSAVSNPASSGPRFEPLARFDAKAPAPLTPEAAPTPLWLPALFNRTAKATHQTPRAASISASASAGGSPHHVRAGETLWQLTRRALPNRASSREVSAGLAKILAANPQVAHRPNLIRAGERLRLPSLTSERDQHPKPTPPLVEDSATVEAPSKTAPRAPRAPSMPDKNPASASESPAETVHPSDASANPQKPAPGAADETPLVEPTNPIKATVNAGAPE